MSKKYKTTGRGHRMINLVLQSEFADDNTDRVASVAAAASVKSPPHLDDSLITPDDLGLINLESISPMSETPSLLLSPTTTADIMPILFSSDDEEEPLVISTRAIVHSNLEGSNEVVSSAANENLNNISVSSQSVRSAKLPSPDLDAILSLGSDVSVQHWVPPSEKRKRRLSVSDSEDEVPLLLLRRSEPSSLENIIPTDEDIEHHCRSKENVVQLNKKARVSDKSYLGFKKSDNGKYKPCVEKPKREIKPRCSHTKLNTDTKHKNSFLCASITEEDRKAIHSYFWGLKTRAEKKTFMKTAAVRRLIRCRRRKDQTSMKKGSGHDIFLNTCEEKCTKGAPAPHEAPQKKTKLTDYYVSDSSKELRVTRMAASDGIPLSKFCTSEDLRHVFKKSGYDLPKSPTTITSIVLELYDNTKNALIRLLKEVKSQNKRFTMTFDEWTSTRNKRYMNINIHSKDLEPANYKNLGLVRIKCSMPADVGTQLIQQHLSNFGLSLEDIVAFTTDGASVMVKMGKNFDGHNQLCFAHGIQLAVLDVLYKSKNQSTPNPNPEQQDKELDYDSEDSEENYGGFYIEIPRIPESEFLYKDTIKKVRDLVKSFKKSPLKNDL
ncbi:unnamed protein product [Parnassius apollo]|uniref:(apollo) hypothetical protein n=1 Tax=Parnassius apollo TaxID=110799 RepID=A0A8S3XGU8_PARAO|nr:unnamed protein product [Parnassius apollo]